MATSPAETHSTSVTLAMLGGLAYLVSAVVVGIVGTVFALLGFLPAFALPGIVAGLVIVGALALVFGYLLRRQPELGLVWSVLLIVVALASLPLAFGGFVIGFLLTLIAGILALAA